MLLSDSSTTHFTENTISVFTTELPHENVLEGEWECSVTEVRYPFTIFNVVCDEIAITNPKNATHQTAFHLTPGFYPKGKVIAEINRFIADDDGKVSMDKHTGKVSVRTGIQTLYMSQDLHDFP